MLPQFTRSDNDRFWSKVNYEGPVVRPDLDQCWVWTSPPSSSGYGQFHIGGKDHPPITAHRFVWLLLIGPIGTGLCVLHRCDNRICVRPSHLFLGTLGDNIDDMRAKGRAVNPPRPDPDTIRERFTGAVPWNKGHRAASCKRGHPFTTENTYIDLRGHQSCRICTALSRERKEKG